MYKTSDNMKKIKIVAMLIATMFVSIAATSISGAEELNANIKVDVDQFVGIVFPVVNATTDEQKNQTLEFLVNVTEPVGEPENYTYVVEDELKVNLDILDNTGRNMFLLPRLVFYRIVVYRDYKEAFDQPGRLLKKLFPIKVPLSSASVVNTLSGPAADNITIGVSYPISNETYHSGENLTMCISVMGFIPGNVNGLIEGQIPIIDRKTINLEVLYKEKVSE